MRTILCFISLITFSVCTLHSQTNLLDTALTNMARQLTLYPKEKLHLHIDRSTYLPGDTLWLKAYTVHSTFHTPLPVSRYVYVELMNPVDSLVQRVKLRRDSLGQISGYLPIPERIPEGVYGLRAYTRYMLQEGEEHLFSRSLQIAPQPEWIHARLAAYSSKAGKKTRFDFNLYDNVNKGIVAPEAKIILPKGKASAVQQREEKVIATFSPNEVANNQSFMLRLSGFGIPSYERYFALSTEQEDYDISFYPEGGYLIGDTECRVAYKAQDISGNSARVHLILQNEAGRVLLADSTLHDGMGSFTFTPQTGKKYKVVAKNGQQLNKVFDLPGVQQAAYSLRTEVRPDHTLQVITLASAGMPMDSLLLMLSIRGIPFHVAPLVDKKTIIDLATCPEGIIQCLLLDSRYNKLSERLCFNHRPARMQYGWNTDKTVYHTGEKVQAECCLTDSLGQPLRGSFSVSVTDSQVGVTDTSHHILSSIFLTSELKGYISNPAFYFDTNNPMASQALDLLLMTHGWKRYNLPHILKGKWELPNEQPEVACSISGKLKAKGLFGKEKQGEVTLTHAKYKFQHHALSTSDGTFRFDGFEFPDWTEFTLQAMSVEDDKQKKQKLVVEVEPEKFAEQPLRMPQEMIRSNGNNGPDAPVYYGKPVVTYLNGMAHVLLNTFTIKPELWGSTNYREMNRNEIASYKAINLSELLKQLDIKTVENQPYFISLFYNKKEVRLFIDSFLYDNRALDYISPENVESILFIEDMDPLNFQLWAGNAYAFHNNRRKHHLQKEFHVLDITLKTSFDPRDISVFQGTSRGEFWHLSYGFVPPTLQIDKTSIYLLGYQSPVEFYSPKYEPKHESDPYEVRPTLFWKPNLQTDEKGRMDFSFNIPGNAPTTLDVTIEGVSEKGEFVYVTKKIIVSEEKEQRHK